MSKRILKFTDVKDGDRSAGDLGTRVGAIATMRQCCRDLTTAEAERAADVALARGMPGNIASIHALLRELFEVDQPPALMSDDLQPQPPAPPPRPK